MPAQLNQASITERSIRYIMKKYIVPELHLRLGELVLSMFLLSQMLSQKNG